MPFSDPRHIATVVHFATALKPDKVLDVGIGMGLYGLLLRHYLDIAHERLIRGTWTVRIDGVEIFENYRNPVWEYAYDSVTIADARVFVPSAGEYDLVLMGDILEHFERNEARILVEVALSRAKTVIATTPHIEMIQSAWAGNAAETHLSLLDATDFPSLVTAKAAADTTCYVCSRDPATIERIKDAAALCPSYRVGFVPYWRRRIVRRLRRELNGARQRGDGLS